MALFIAATPDYEGVLKDTLIAPHKGHPLIATGWMNPTSVLITNNEGEILTNIMEPAGGAPAANKNISVASLAWHPVEPLLAIGWSNGKVSTWHMPPASSLGLSEDASGSTLFITAKSAALDDVEGSVREHGASPVLSLEWSTNGMFCFASSQNKQLVVWSLEQTATETIVIHKLKPLHSATAAAPVVRSFHVTGVEGGNGGPRGSEDEVRFLLVDGSGAVAALVDDKLTPCCSVQGESIVSIIYDAPSRTLVTLDSRGYVDAFHVSEDLTGTLITRRKLSLPAAPSAADRLPLSMAWVGPDTVALSAGDDNIRILNIATESLSFITFPQEGVHVSFLTALEERGLMAVGTTEGVLGLFQRPTTTASKKGVAAAKQVKIPAGVPALGQKVDAACEWEPTATHRLGKRIDRISFTPLGDMAVCSDSRCLQVLHKTIRKRGWDGVAAATQISADMVVIESVTGCQCLLKSKGTVRGVSTAFPHIALWNGSQIDMYTINEATSDFTLVNFVPSTSPAFAIHKEGIFYVKENRVLFQTMQLSPIAQMTFTEAEGTPVLLSIMNNFIVAVSSKNYLRLARISSHDLQQMGAARPLHFASSSESGEVDADVVVCSASVNAQGRRVALMTKVGPVGVPDSRVWVYDADNDKLTSFDFAPRFEMPDAIYWNTPEPNSNTIGELEYLLLACETHQLGAGRKDRTQDGAASSVAGDSNASTPAHNQSAHHEDLPEALPDMENFVDQRDAGDASRRGSLGATNFIGGQQHNLVTLFATHDGLVVHDSTSLRPYQICLVGLTIPDFLLASVKINGNASNAEDYVIEQKRLRDFEGLKSDKDVVVREALMKFSYYSTIGNMDEAYRCIKSIKNPAAWQGLARMCVSNGRLDVAAVCLATMEDCVAARALREAREDYPDDKNVQLATLACNLDMMDECEALLRASKRYDLMTDIFLARGKFEQAQRHTERMDRIRIRPVAYKYAQFMESLQNMDAAIMWYYSAKCAGTDVPRIYFQNNRMHELRDLLMPRSQAQTPTSNAGGGASLLEPAQTLHPTTPLSTSEEPRATFAKLFPQNRDLILWWAQNCERRRNVQESLRFFHAGKDVYNVVRLLCSLSPPKIENAVEIVNTEVERAKMRFQQQQSFAGGPSAQGSGEEGVAEPDPVGAAFFIGQFYEKQGNANKALQYYKHAGAYRSGVRVAWRAQQHATVASLSVQSGDERLMLESAVTLEKYGVHDRAVELYRKVGAIQCALDACISGGLYDTLHELSTSLASSSTDPAVFLGMADHFQNQGQYQKAVEMLVFAKKYEDALKMCEERSVTLTELMAEAITGDGNKLPSDEKLALVRRVAHIAKDQGSWSLACKKYTQAGDRVKAMKMLMRGGEVEKVIFFANHSRNAEIYTMAANFLQSQNWSTDANVYKSIILFYTKAKAYGSLISFYESCTQLQIDENRNYAEALRTLMECIAALEKAGKSAANDLEPGKSESLKQRAEIIGGFVKSQRIVESMQASERGTPDGKKKSDSVIAVCSDFIKRSRPSSPDQKLIEDSLRIGDVFALLVRMYFDKMGEAVNALKVLESMPKHGAEPQFFLEKDVMEKICQANGKKLTDVVPNASDAATPSSRRRSSVLEDLNNVA